MTDDLLRQQQRHNDLKAFLDYEQRLRDAYARSQDQNPRRWLRAYTGRHIRRHSQLTSLDSAQGPSVAAILGQSPGS